MGKPIEVLRIVLANKDNDEIVIYRETVNRRTIYKAELYGGTEGNRFGSFKLRGDPVFQKTFTSLKPVLDEVLDIAKREKIASMRIKAFLGTPFPYYLKEPGRKTFSEKYKREALKFAETVLTRSVEQVEVFFSEGKLIFLHVEGNRARFLAPLQKDEFEDKLPSRKIARAVGNFVKSSKSKAVDYVPKLRNGNYLVIPTDKREFIASLYTIAYSKELWE